MADMKVAAYICQGCGLGERLDTADLAKVAQKEGKVQLVKQHPFLCNAEGVATIRNDIDNEAVTHVVIAACSRRAKTEAFGFEDVAVSRANLREGVIWIRPDDEASRETTQEMAADYVRMGCAEAKKMKMPQIDPAAVTERTRAGRGRRHLRHDHRVGNLQGRLQGRAGGKGRRAGRLGRQAVQAFPRQVAVRRSAGHRRRGDGRRRERRCQHQGLHQRPHQQDRGRAGAFPGRRQRRVRCDGYREGRLHRPGHRLHPVRRQQAARAGLRQNRQCGRPSWPGSACQGRQRRSDASAPRTAAKSRPWCSCSAPASATRPAPICRTVPAPAA